MFIVIVLLIVLYFVPILVASYRSSRHIGLVAGLSLALGWTIIGWIAGLVLALTGKEGKFAGPKTFPTTGPPTGGYLPPAAGSDAATPYPGSPYPDGPSGFTRE